ncbi:tyrosine-type recombinase/integrase [Arenimonas malthae]|nr:integrase arm-type DNA-binding domain-containing protein [Arenimonas malthae]
MPLTDAAIRAAKPRAKPFKLSDSGGLYLEIAPSGGKWWRYKYRLAGREKRLSLGTYPDTSLADARDRHAQARKLVAQGIDPSAHRKAEKAANVERVANSFEVVAREWLAVKRHEWTEKQHAKEQARLEKHAFPFIGREPVGSLGVRDIRPLIERPAKAGHLEQAHRLRYQLSRVFQFAVATERAERDPAGDLRAVLPARNKNRHFATITDPTRVGELLRAIDGFTGTFPVACALKLAPLWFCRPGEIRMAEWAHFDLDGSDPVYRVPPAIRKLRKNEKENPNTQPHLIPLATQALAILRELQQLTGRGRYLFPGARDPKRHMSDGTINAAIARIGFKGELVGHGFRHMASTMLNELGYRPEVVERQLSHKVAGVEGVYNKSQLISERKQMMQAWADYLDALKAGPTGKITPIKRRVA